MTPDAEAVRELDASLAEKNMGVVAHYYMDAELQVKAVGCRKEGGARRSAAVRSAAVRLVSSTRGSCFLLVVF